MLSHPCHTHTPPIVPHHPLPFLSLPVIPHVRPVDVPSQPVDRHPLGVRQAELHHALHLRPIHEGTGDGLDADVGPVQPVVDAVKVDGPVAVVKTLVVVGKLESFV